MIKVSKLIGVTLLEIMLVLAIAAMIIVMSVRYYQSANSSQQANAAVVQIQSIVGAANSLSQPSGTYANLTDANIAASLPGVGLNTPWGSTISTGSYTASSFVITVPDVPVSVCPNVAAKLGGDDHFTPKPLTCSASGPSTLAITYTANP